MKLARAHLESISPYSQSRFHMTAKLDKERGVDYEERTWRERCHRLDNGTIHGDVIVCPDEDFA